MKAYGTSDEIEREGGMCALVDVLGHVFPLTVEEARFMPFGLHIVRGERVGDEWHVPETVAECEALLQKRAALKDEKGAA